MPHPTTPAHRFLTDRRWYAALFGALTLLGPSLVGALVAQQNPAPPPRPLINGPTVPALQGFRWREIGPAGQGGRIDDFATDEKNPSTFFIGFAVSGVWRTLNNGTTFDPVFDTYGVSSIGDLALAPSNANVLYVGTGEANNRQSSSIGNGVWKSTNAAAATAADVQFENVGLKDTQSIARIIVHPKDPNIVWVAANGHLFGPNPERGVFMTTDGGKTWNKTLYLGPDVGATELIIDPSNPMNLWAAMYEHRRTAWGYVGGGPGSGLHQSTDGGKTWKRVTGNGLPRGTLGRIALDICRTQPNVIYAQIETAPDKETGADLDQPAAAAPGGRGARGAAPAAPPAATAGAPQAAAVPGAGGGRGAPAPPDPQSNGVWKSTDKGRTWTFMSNENQRPMYFSQIRVDPNDPATVYVGGVNPMKSVDGGKTFAPIRGMGHVDNHAIWIDPLNSKHVFYGNDGGMDVSYDAGATWESIRMWGAALSYHVSADLRRPYWVCTGLQDNGSWCGPSSTRSGGIHQWNWISVGGGDGFQTQIDPNDPTVFYTESQNLGIVRYNLSTGQTASIQPSTGRGGRGGAAGGEGLPAGGEGAPIVSGAATAASAGTVAGAPSLPAGNAANAPGVTGVGAPPATGAAAPAVAGAEAPAAAPAAAGGRGGRINVVNLPPPSTIIAFNWNSPIRLSPHNPTTLYVGGRQMFISRDRGETWTITSSLGKNVDPASRSLLEQSYSLPGCGRGAVRGKPCILSKNDGMVANEFGTLTELAESSVLPGVLWAGTDDGNVQVSKDGGNSFTEVGKNIPVSNHEYYVSGIEASWYDAGTAYVALDGHRHDDYKPYIFKTTDYGQTWKAIAGNLPDGQVNSVRQDPVNRNLLYAPAEFGFYVSLNDGTSWDRFMPNLPTMRIDEVLVHPRDHDLILATHSRGVWIMDDISSLQGLTPDVIGRDATLFKPRDPVQWKNDYRNQTEVPGDKWWSGEVAPRGTAIAYYLKAAGGAPTITIANTATGQTVRTCTGTSLQGLNRFQWPLVTDQQLQAAAGGRGGRGGAAATPAIDTTSCTATAAAGRGGGGGGGGRGGAAGALGPGVYRVTLTVGGREVGAQTFSLLEDTWLNEK